MKLEQSLYEAKPVEKQVVYQVGDLESLSATELYWIPIEKSTMIKFGMVETPMMKSGPVAPSAPTLKVRPLSTMDLHIHQKGDLINSANIKPHGAKDGEPLTNYEACMADLYAGLLKKKTLIFPDKNKMASKLNKNELRKEIINLYEKYLSGKDIISEAQKYFMDYSGAKMFLDETLNGAIGYLEILVGV